MRSARRRLDGGPGGRRALFEAGLGAVGDTRTDRDIGLADEGGQRVAAQPEQRVLDRERLRRGAPPAGRRPGGHDRAAPACSGMLAGTADSVSDGLAGPSDLETLAEQMRGWHDRRSHFAPPQAPGLRAAGSPLSAVTGPLPRASSTRHAEWGYHRFSVLCIPNSFHRYSPFQSPSHHHCPPLPPIHSSSQSCVPELADICIL